MLFDVKDTSNPPAGAYRARFLGATQIEHDSYGPGALFTWEILDGDQAGKTAGRVTDIKATTSNATGRIIAGLTGGPVKAGGVSVESCVGKVYLIQVDPTSDGKKTRVTSCIASA